MYAAEPSTKNQERKRLKQHAIQAEKEIILSTVFGVCSNMFSSFTHYSEKTEQSPNPSVQACIHVMLVFKVISLFTNFNFLYWKLKKTSIIMFCSSSLLTFCLEDYWEAYDKLQYIILCNLSFISAPKYFL